MNSRTFHLGNKEFKAFIGLIIYSLIYVLPIILANFYYIDDLGRSLEGYTGWNGNGRPIASLLAIILSDGKPLMDISPWIQIASVIAFNYSLILFVRKYAVKASSFQIFCIAACSYLNLFLLENFSYKYDSFGMLLSLSLFIMLFSLPETFNTKSNLLVSVCTVIISLSIYQAAIGAYISLALVEALYLLYQKEHWNYVIKRIAIRIIGILIGGIIYKVAIVRLFVKDGYSLEHAGLIDLFSKQGIQRLYDNINAFVHMFNSYRLTLGILGILLLIVLYIGLVHIAYSLWKQRNELFPLKLISLCFVLAFPLFLVIASVIALVLLNEPVIAPRVMLSFTVFALFVGFIIYHLSKVKKAFLFVAVLALICSLSFSSYYGNLLTSQEKTNFFVASSIVHDMNGLEQESGRQINHVSFIGHSPKCHELLLASKKRPLFDRLVPIYMNNNWYWGGKYLSHYRKSKVSLKRDDDDKSYTDSTTPNRRNEFYRMYLRDNKVIVLFQ